MSNSPKWNPVTHPWRVTVWLGYARPRGTSDNEVSTYASESEARVAFDAQLPKFGVEVVLDFAEHAEAWLTNGQWRRIARRKDRKR